MSPLVEQEGYSWNCDSCNQSFPNAKRHLGCRLCAWDLHALQHTAQHVDSIRASVQGMKVSKKEYPALLSTWKPTSNNGEPPKVLQEPPSYY